MMNLLSASTRMLQRLLEEFRVGKTAQQIAENCHENLTSRLNPQEIGLSGHQLRGYLRARSAVEIRRQISELVSHGRPLPEDLQRELYQFTADRLVNSLMLQAPKPALVLQSPRRAA